MAVPCRDSGTLEPEALLTSTQPGEPSGSCAAVGPLRQVVTKCLSEPRSAGIRFDGALPSATVWHVERGGRPAFRRVRYSIGDVEVLGVLSRLLPATTAKDFQFQLK